MSFLGTRRSEIIYHTEEVPKTMLLPAVFLIALILCIGLMAPFFGGAMIGILRQLTGINPSTVLLEEVSHALRMTSSINMLLIAVVGVTLVIRAWRQARVKVSAGPTWGCGYSAGDFRHQYTPTSYADSLRQLVDPVIDYRRNYKSFDEREIFPPPKTFDTEAKDLIEEKTVLSWVNLLTTYLPRAGVAQSGLINHYLIYPMLFLLILGLLTFLNVI
jgi:NADH:ubiquinone oxidoreductase subunit 5 (subunit L)/multisubunit Na+/H+ antiporter MnhA subunit